MHRIIAITALLGAACTGSTPCEVGQICAWAGSGVAGFAGDEGPALEAQLYLPMEVAFGADGRAYVVDWNNHRIRSIDAEGVIRTVPGTGEIGDEADVASASSFNHPTSAAFDAQGRLLIAAWHNSRVKRLDVATGTIENLYGTGKRAYVGDDGPASAAVLDLPTAVAVGPAGAVYIVDQANQVVRRVDAAGTISRVVGRCVAGVCEEGEAPVACEGSNKLACVKRNSLACATPCLPGDGGDGGPATDARLSLPVGQAADPGGRLAFDAAGVMYLADTKNHRIRRIALDGVITTAAGTGVAGASGDGGAATAALVNKPIDVEVGPDGDVYFTDTGNSCVRAFTPGGTIRTVAGKCGTPGNKGDSGAATEATLDHPYGLAFDRDGQLYVVDTMNSRVRRVRLK